MNGSSMRSISTSKQAANRSTSAGGVPLADRYVRVDGLRVRYVEAGVEHPDFCIGVGTTCDIVSALAQVAETKVMRATSTVTDSADRQAGEPMPQVSSRTLEVEGIMVR